jgi:hypothetical protein
VVRQDGNAPGRGCRAAPSVGRVSGWRVEYGAVLDSRRAAAALHPDAAPRAPTPRPLSLQTRPFPRPTASQAPPEAGDRADSRISPIC